MAALNEQLREMLACFTTERAQYLQQHHSTSKAEVLEPAVTNEHFGCTLSTPASPRCGLLLNNGVRIGQLISTIEAGYTLDGALTVTRLQ